MNQPIPLSSARTLIPFVDYLRGIGAPVARRLEHCRLPSGLCEMPDAYISTLKHWEFIARAGRKEGVDGFALRVGDEQGYQLIGPRVLSRVIEAPSLLWGIDEFARLIRGESSAFQVGLYREGESVQLVVRRAFGKETFGFRETEWLAVIALVKLVRLFAGCDWTPDSISLQSAEGVLPPAEEIFPDARFLMRQERTCLGLPAELLSLGPTKSSSEIVSSLSRPAGGLAPGAPPSSFGASIKLVLRTYLADGYPPLETMAEVSGMSKRTLQRRLAECGLTYSKVVDQARFGLAADLLADPGVTSAEIARATGYNDPSHFARAFRRISGCSPLDYRRRRQDGRAPVVEH